MAEDYCLTWNAWRVWFHPRRALDALEDAGFMQENLESRLDNTSALLEEQKNESLRLTEEAGELTRRLAEKETELEDVRQALEDTRRELRDVREMLVEQKEIDRQLREFDAELTKVEAMKNRYEKRIAELETRLRDAARIGRRGIEMGRHEAETELIDPSDPESMPVAPRCQAPEQRAPISERDRCRRQEAGDDWLLELPEDL